MKLTTKEIQRYIQGKPINVYGSVVRSPAPYIVCQDGFKVSVQAGEYLYSEPRQDFAGYYWKAEIGFPSHEPPEYIREYAEDDSDYCNTVYPYTPIGHIVRMINEHGGIDHVATVS